MVKLNDLKKRQKAKFIKEAEALSDKYSKILIHHMSLNFQRFAGECFNLVEKYTGDNKPLEEKEL